MKNIVLIVVLAVLYCSPMALHAENNPHLLVPQSINLGLCARGDSNAAHICSQYVTLTNTSTEDLYLENSWMEGEFSSDYSKFGIIFYPYGCPGFFVSKVVIPAKQSREISIWFFSHQTGDTGAVEFKSKLIIRSRTSPMFPLLPKDLYSDTLFIKATAVDSPTIFADTFNYHEAKQCSSVYTEQFVGEYRVRFFNHLPESVTLDSLHSEITGNFIPQIAPISFSTRRDTTLPIDLSAKSNIHISISYGLSPYGENKRVVLTGYFTGKTSQKRYTATSYLSSKDTLLPSATFYSSSSAKQSDDGERQLDKNSVLIETCSSESIWLDSIVFTPAWAKDELKITSDVIILPLLLDPIESYRFDLAYNPQTHGRTFGFVQAYFHTTDGRQIVRTLDFQTYFPDSVSSVGEIREDNHASPSLLITEPNLPLKLLGTYLDTPKLYDSYGNFIDLSARLEQGYISLEGLSSGVYCFVFKTSVGMVSRKVLYLR